MYPGFGTASPMSETALCLLYFVRTLHPANEKRLIMKKKLLKIAIAASLVVLASAIASTRIEAKSPKQSEHDRIIKFWTNARIARAVPRDFVRNPKSRSFKQIQWNRGIGTTPTAASWLGNGEVSKSTGKVFFSMGTTYYVCSGSVILENATDRSLVVTAAHCAYDEVKKQFAENWLFVPEYYTKPAALSPDKSFCDYTQNGCWTSERLVVSSDYANAGSFNDQAVLHDFAFAAVGLGGKTGTANLDLLSVTGGHAVVYDKRQADVNTWIFGYPAANRYKGKALMYCNGLLGYDARMNNQTYRLPCSLTAGSSGGPWLNPFASSTGSGDQFSVNSYTYGGSKAMYGPVFTSETGAMFSRAQTATENVIYSSAP